MAQYDDKSFSKDFAKLTKHLTGRISKAATVEEVTEEFRMLEGLATNKNSPASAKTIYGLAYLMDEKPWYDFQKGMEWVKAGADEAEANEAFCWFVLGSLYLEGKPELPVDPILAKHWICKAADAGYSDAILAKEIEWGENPPGFKEWLNENSDRVEKTRKRQFSIIVFSVLAIICLVLWFLLR